MRKKSVWVLVVIIATVVLAGFFVYPGNLVANSIPWRLGLDLVGGSALVYEVDLSNINAEDQADAVSGLKEVIERRINIYGVSEPRVALVKKGDSYQLLVELAGVNVEDAARQIGETPVLDFREVVQDGVEITYVPTELTGRNLKRAGLGFDNLTNTAIVLLEFDDEGTSMFADITARNVGKPLAVFLDGAPLTAPVVQQAITGGSAQITGGGAGFAADEAKLLVERFNAGALSAPIKLINQRKVSASAAEDSLNQIILAGLIGTAAVLVFMIIFYRSLGVFAGLALSMYIVLTLALFKLIPNFTMTLAGIAGFVLSIGMAVDANILIFERTREELRAGHSRGEATNEGFKRAWPSIRDSNTTTIITSTILYALTSSFVRGFALTLGLGVVVSMFSAIFITRTMLRAFTKV
jgi:protein-export membrane protein SecD